MTRKSLFRGPDDQKRPRDRRGVRDQVAEVVAAFANAEGRRPQKPDPRRL